VQAVDRFVQMIGVQGQFDVLIGKGQYRDLADVVDQPCQHRAVGIETFRLMRQHRADRGDEAAVRPQLDHLMADERRPGGKDRFQRERGDEVLRGFQSEPGDRFRAAFDRLAAAVQGAVRNLDQTRGQRGVDLYDAGDSGAVGFFIIDRAADLEGDLGDRRQDQFVVFEMPAARLKQPVFGWTCVGGWGDRFGNWHGMEKKKNYDKHSANQNKTL